ncbi:MAG: hypothetical protein WDN24_06440 [Sphingomonas sp.]
MKPEYIDSFEVGLRSILFDRRVRFQRDRLLHGAARPAGDGVRRGHPSAM